MWHGMSSTSVLQPEKVDDGGLSPWSHINPVARTRASVTAPVRPYIAWRDGAERGCHIIPACVHPHNRRSRWMLPPIVTVEISTRALAGRVTDDGGSEPETERVLVLVRAGWQNRAQRLRSRLQNGSGRLPLRQQLRPTQRCIQVICSRLAIANCDATLGDDRCGLRVHSVARMLAMLDSLVPSLLDRHQVSTAVRQVRRFASHSKEARAWML
jgi:hypothetical protein